MFPSCFAAFTGIATDLKHPSWANSVATTTPHVGPPSANNCLLSLKSISTANFNTHQVLRCVSCFLRAWSPREDNASSCTSFVVIQRNSPKGRKHFIGQSEPGEQSCLARLVHREPLTAVAHTWGSHHTELPRYVPAREMVAKKGATFLNFKVSIKPRAAWRTWAVWSFPAQELGTTEGSLNQ